METLNTQGIERASESTIKALIEMGVLHVTADGVKCSAPGVYKHEK